MNFFSLTFQFSNCVPCLFPGLFPVIFTSHMLSYTEHQLEYFCYMVIFLLPPFIALANHKNAFKIVCILFPNSQSYFSFFNPLWVNLNSQRIQIDHKFVQHNPNNPYSLSTTQKKKHKQRKQLILTNSKNILL